MPRDKQLRRVSLQQAIRKRTLDQALNPKEFAVLAGISYSAARSWFHEPGFPVVHRMVFWRDFVLWRTAHAGLAGRQPPDTPAAGVKPPAFQSVAGWPARAAQILREADEPQAPSKPRHISTPLPNTD